MLRLSLNLNPNFPNWQKKRKKKERAIFFLPTLFQSDTHLPPPHHVGHGTTNYRELVKHQPYVWKTETWGEQCEPITSQSVSGSSLGGGNWNRRWWWLVKHENIQIKWGPPYSCPFCPLALSDCNRYISGPHLSRGRIMCCGLSIKSSVFSIRMFIQVNQLTNQTQPSKQNLLNNLTGSNYQVALTLFFSDPNGPATASVGVPLSPPPPQRGKKFGLVDFFFMLGIPSQLGRNPKESPKHDKRVYSCGKGVKK